MPLDIQMKTMTKTPSSNKKIIIFHNKNKPILNKFHSLDLTESFIKLSSYSTKELRSIKQDIEKLILDKIKKLEKMRI